MKQKYYKTLKIKNGRTRKIKHGSGIFKKIGSTIYNTVKRATKIPNDVWKNRKNIKKSIKHIAKSKYIPTVAINPSNVHRILFKASNYIDFLDETSIIHLYCKDNENYNHDDAEELRQTDDEIKDLTEKYNNLFRVGNSEENERNKDTLEYYKGEIQKLKKTKTSLEYNLKKCLSIEESQIYPFQPNQQEIDKRMHEDEEYKTINNKLNKINENITRNEAYLNSYEIQSSEDGELPVNKIKDTDKNLLELKTQKDILENQMNAIYEKYNHKYYDEKDDSILKTLKRFDFSKLNDAIITDVENEENNNSAIFFWQPELFEFFHTYKYQVNRALWYGGWNSWSVIINEMSKFISKNDDIAIEYKNILWGTSGALKFLQQIFGNNNNNNIMSIIKGLTPEYIQKLFITNQKNAYKQLESDDNNNMPDVDNAQYKQPMFTNITRKIRSYADKVGEQISKTL